MVSGQHMPIEGSMKEFQLCGLGNAIVDIFVELEEQKALLHRFKDREPRLVSGGSVANSVIAFSQLGGHAAFIGCVGDDRYGLFYASEFEELKIEIGSPVI